MIRIAITGGIGSGKSAVRRIAEALGGYSIDADEVNSRLLKNPDYIERLGKLFPQAVENGVVNRHKLSDIVFSDKDSLIKLNALAHPLITGIIMYEAEISGCSKVFVEVPLLAESGIEKFFDRIWYVDADRETRIKRVMDRSGISRESVLKVISMQDERAGKALATDVINNDGTAEALWEEVQRLYLSL